MAKQDLTNLQELDATEVDAVSGGMRLPPYSPNIRVEDQRHYRYFFGRSSGPLAGGYVTSH